MPLELLGEVVAVGVRAVQSDQYLFRGGKDICKINQQRGKRKIHEALGLQQGAKHWDTGHCVVSLKNTKNNPLPPQKIRILIYIAYQTYLPINLLTCQKQLLSSQDKKQIKDTNSEVPSKIHIWHGSPLIQVWSHGRFFCCSLSSTLCPSAASLDLIQEALNVRLAVDTRHGASASGPGSAPCGTPQPVLGQPSQMSRDILMEKAKSFIKRRSERTERSPCSPL